MSGTRPAARVVLLGASNLVRGFPVAVAHLRASTGAPIEILCAHGRGRSYGGPARFAGRELCGIGECGLWAALGNARADYALLTDVGNDILYGASVDAIAGWVERDLDRLAASGARTVVTRLPLASLATLQSWRFHVVHRLFFPTRRADYRVARARAYEVDEKMCALARARGMALVEPPGEWFGLDPIHIRLRRRDAAWRAILAAWGLVDRGAESPRLALADRLRLSRARPERRRVLGIEQRRDQPSVTLLDGTTVALY